MKKASLAITLGLLAIGIGLATAGLRADDDQEGARHFQFVPKTLVVTRSLYVGRADTVTIGETLPPGCAGGPNGTTTAAVPTTSGGVVDVQVPCGVASDNGEAPNVTQRMEQFW